jgi:hypothetical protein
VHVCCSRLKKNSSLLTRHQRPFTYASPTSTTLFQSLLQHNVPLPYPRPPGVPPSLASPMCRSTMFVALPAVSLHHEPPPEKYNDLNFEALYFIATCTSEAPTKPTAQLLLHQERSLVCRELKHARSNDAQFLTSSGRTQPRSLRPSVRTTTQLTFRRSSKIPLVSVISATETK